jgi:hypothetical protein
MDSELTSRERYLLSDHFLGERLWELRLGMAVLAIFAIGCAAGLVVGLCGLALPELVWEALWGGVIAGVGGAVVAWREKRWISLLRKLKHRLSELESEPADQRLPGEPKQLSGG